MLKKKIAELLQQKEFIHVATCDSSLRPNAAPKFFLNMEGDYIYLVDYTIGTTWRNLKDNPRVSLSVMDDIALIGYQINGIVAIIEQGPEHERLFEHYTKKGISLSATRIIEGLYREKTHVNFEVNLPQNVVFFKIRMEDIAEIGSGGGVTREQV